MAPKPGMWQPDMPEPDTDNASPRVLQAIAGAAHGGAEAYFVRLCVALAGDGVTQRVVMRPNEARRRALEGAALSVAEAPFGGRLDLRTRKLIAAEIDAFKPDIVMSYMSRASRFVPRSKSERGYVTIGRLGGYYDLKYYRHLDHLVCNTRDLVDYVISEGWPMARAHFVPNFVLDHSEPAAARAPLRTPDDAPLIFALGRFHPNKAFDTLLRALADLPDHYLWLAGEGPQRRALEDLADDLGVAGRLRFLGWRDDPAPYYAACDVFVLPSRHEPLGNVMLEAWMHGRPVVATESQGPCELVESDSEAVLVPVDAPAALAAAIGDVTGDPERAASLARAGRAAYERDYTQAIAVARHRALFDAVLKERHGR
ncbi:MAG TPA: glycosyltransferase [Alphaproteobacteria bacterium]|nr:glycosyltransferase [Alphaproteobacteria bacterium]